MSLLVRGLRYGKCIKCLIVELFSCLIVVFFVSLQHVIYIIVMKPIAFIGLLLFCLSGFAQKSIEEKDLPLVITEGFKLAYPDVPQHSWEQRNTRYIATIKYEDHTEFATFLETGEWAETRYDIDKSDLPEKVVAFLDSHYDAYRIEQLNYVEENGGGNYYAILMALKSNKELTTELIFDLGGDIQMVDGLTVKENSEHGIVVNEDDNQLLKPGIQKEIIDVNKGVPDMVLLNLAKRYGAVEKIKWSKTNLGFHRAEYKFRDNPIATEWDDEGNQASQITFFNKKNAVYLIQKFLEENYPRATFISGERVVYETKFTRMFPDKGLKSYFVIEISNKPKGVKEPTFYTVYFDNTGQLDMIVEKENPNNTEENE